MYNLFDLLKYELRNRNRILWLLAATLVNYFANSNYDGLTKAAMACLIVILGMVERYAVAALERSLENLLHTLVHFPLHLAPVSLVCPNT